ncbi:MAG: hypothetical protein F4X48_01885 [Acidimicrobiia bacterium]|nr:hypothetical protein [Acidimicrobiia bacterium]MYC57332.1 hypothetical protein [Acidimicrobiia bacterium]MYI31033.1 hypothetical protein [Acidimicrobiia bacterium]
MAFIAAPYLIAALLLGAAGAAKTITPSAAAEALTKLGVPNSLWTIRLLGLLELTVATGAFIVGGVLPASALAGLYGSFAIVSVAMLHKKTGAHCGCFGKRPMPASSRHVIVNLLATASGTAAAAWRISAADKLFETNRWLYAPLAITVLGGAYGVFLWLSQPRKQP